MLGSTQYLIFAAGYDTFAYRQPKWAEKPTIFEIDHPATASDKKLRMERLYKSFPANLTTLSVDFNLAGWTEGDPSHIYISSHVLYLIHHPFNKKKPHGVDKLTCGQLTISFYCVNNISIVRLSFTRFLIILSQIEYLFILFLVQSPFLNQ